MLTTRPIFPRSSSLNPLEEKYNQKSPVVTWLSPQENDTFGSWDTLTAKWNSREVLDSPAFRLCTLDDSLQAPFLSCHNETEDACLDDNCGPKISPSIEESDGSFLINFIVPDIASDAFFVLQMNDASGAVLSSPIFKLSSHPVHFGVRTRLSPQPNFTLDTATSRQPSLVVGFTILLIIVCMLLMIPLLLWLCRRHGKNVKMYFRRWKVSQTSTPALLTKIDPGDGTSVPIPLFLPTQAFRAPSQSMRLPKPLVRASGVHQPLHAGSSRSFRVPNRYSGGSIYHSLPPIPTSSNTFIDEGNTMMANSTLTNTYISGLPLPPPGLLSTPPRVHLRPSD